MSKAESTYYYLKDELGSLMYMTGTDGAAVSSYAFDDFGRGIDLFTGKIKETGIKHTNGIEESCNKHAYTKEGNIIQPFAFTGYQEDEVSGLVFAQARFYDATSGRFQSEDIRKGVINNSLTLNHYGYCFGNPVGFSDKNGKWPGWMEDAWDTACDVASDVKDAASDAWDATCDAVSDFAEDTVNAVKEVGTFVAEHPVEVAVTAAAITATALTGGAAPALFVAGASLVGGGVYAACSDGDKEDAFATGMALTSAATSLFYMGASYFFAGATYSEEFLQWLNKGEANNKVYFGIDFDNIERYVGITKQAIESRWDQHVANGKPFEYLRVIYDGLTRNQARAIEQYYIENGPNELNKINSISPNSPYYEEALRWAAEYIKNMLADSKKTNGGFVYGFE